MQKFVFVIVASVLLLTSCEKEKQAVVVHHTGALKTMMSGDLIATVSLDTLSQKRNLYALGAFENLKGEIQVFDGNAVNSRVLNDEIQITSSLDEKAALLVWTYVEEWIEIKIPLAIESMAHLETYVFDEAVKNGIDVEKPFPFLIDGKVQQLDWHVIDWVDGDMVHTHEKHQQAGKSGSLSDRNVEILGFYSQKHQTIFTHHSTFLHLHFRTEDHTIAGHVDDLKLSDSLILKLPKR